MTGPGPCHLPSRGGPGSGAGSVAATGSEDAPTSQGRRRLGCRYTSWAEENLAERLRLIRRELSGEHGSPELARRLGLPAQTWFDDENGVSIPGTVLLRFIELTSVEPRWLLTGQGPRYRGRSDDPDCPRTH